MNIFRIIINLNRNFYIFRLPKILTLEKVKKHLAFCSLMRIFAIIMRQKEHTVIISLASNENQEANMATAREQLTQLLTEVHFTSAIWTEPVNCSRKEPYLNQLCKGTTAFSEGLLCEVLKETEKRLGRTRNEDGIVAIDLDLLQYDNQRHHLRDWERNYVKNLISEL